MFYFKMYFFNKIYFVKIIALVFLFFNDKGKLNIQGDPK